jgi:hypothetical protein
MKSHIENKNLFIVSIMNMKNLHYIIFSKLIFISSLFVCIISFFTLYFDDIVVWQNSPNSWWR